MKLYAYVEKGIGKPECEDRVLIGDTILAGGFLEVDRDSLDNLLVAIADGVGGYAGGEKASLMTVDGLRLLNRRNKLIKEDIQSLLERINTSIVQTGNSIPGLSRMSTTLTALVMNEESAYSIHIGNCRIWTYKKYLKSVTKDHTVVAEQLQKGEISPEEAWKSEIKHHITGCLGAGDGEYFGKLEIEEQENLLLLENNLILTCDGIHDYVREAQLEELLVQEGTAYQICRKIAETARANNSKDDISIIIVDRIGKYQAV